MQCCAFILGVMLYCFNSVKDIMELHQAERFLECIPPEAEAGSVMVGKVDFVDHPVSAFIRLSEGRILGIRVITYSLC